MQSWRVISEGRRWMPGWKTVHKRDEEEHAHSVEQVKMSVRVICDRVKATGVKEKVYKTAVRPVLMYNLETVALMIHFHWQ